MAITRIKNNQITDASAGNIFLGVNAASKLQDYSITSGKIANNLTYNSSLTITGNLTVQGNTTTIDTTNLVVEDPLIILASEQTGAPALDIGFIGERGTENNIAFIWDESADEFATVFTTDLVTNTTITINSYANLHTLNLDVDGNIDIGGNIVITGNIAGNLNITGNLAAGNISAVSAIAAGTTVNATGNITGGNLVSNAAVSAATTVSATGNITGGNLVSNAAVSAATTISAIGNVTGGNLVSNASISAATTISATGNVSGGNIISNAAVVATGNITTTTGNIFGGNIATSGLLNATGNITGGNLVSNASISAATTVNATGNITGGNLISNAAVVASDLISSGTTISATGNITGGNIISNSAINGATLTTTGNAFIGGNLTVQGNITYQNVDDLRVEDPVIIMGTGANGAPLTSDDGMDRGIYMEYYKSGATGNAFVGWDNSTGNMIAATSVNFSGNNIINVLAFGTFQTGNILAQSATITGNVSLGNISTPGQITATGNITGGNLVSNATISAATTVNATGNITGGNLISNAAVVATGNITTTTGNILGGNIATTGVITATGNVTGGNLVSNASISAATTISATGNITGGNVISNAALIGTTLSVTGNANVGNLGTAGLIVATGNVTGGNINTAGQVVATGNIRGGNLILTTGIIDGPSGGRVTINGSDLDTDFAVDGNTRANLFYVDAGTSSASFGNATQTTNALVAFNSSTSILVPVGNSAQRPSVGVTGMVRFNTTTDVLEFYDADSWVSAGSVFTVIDSEVFNGDGTTLVFTLGSDQTTDSCIVSINGILQIPVTAYSVSGNVLTFTEAPLSQDVIEVREITTTVTVKALSNTPGNAIIELSDTSNDISITGDLIPTSNVTFDLGSSALRWRDAYFSGSSITLGNIVLKNTTGNTLAFFGPDGTTPGTLSSNNVDTTSIANGTASVQTFNNANVAISAGGTSNVFLAQSTGVSITGNLSVTGNATLSGNILGDRIQNGTTQIDIQTQDGNANITVGGVSNVAVFSTTGVTVTGNVNAGNLNVTNNIIDSGPLEIITSSNGNITLSPNGTGVIVANKDIRNGQANGVGNIGTTGGFFNTIFAKATSAQYADLAEMYETDAEYPPGTVMHFGGDREVTICDVANCRKVAGVVSTNPSYLMNSTLTGEHVVAVALTGRVPCRVRGPVIKGDLMVSAGDGSAMANNEARVGTVIGKALEDFSGAEGVIEVVVGRV